MSTSEPMTQEQLDAIQERVNAATTGQWTHDYSGNVDQVDPDGARIADNLTQADAEFIAHARQDVPALLAEVERLKPFEPIVSWWYGDTTDGRTREDMVERAARALYLQEIAWSSKAEWDRLPDPVKKMWHLKAGAALDAALDTGEGS